MVIHDQFQISPSRNKRFDTLLHVPYLERTESEYALSYYLLKNPDLLCYFILGVELLPFQSIIMRTLIRKPYPMLILGRGCGKTFVLGVYSALRACITGNSKIVLVGGNRRQSRFIFAEASKIYWDRNASIFRDLVPKPPNDLPEGSTMLVGKGDDKQSSIIALPLAAGDRIRGTRSSCLIVDEFAIIPKDIFNTVLKPTGSVSLNPVGKVKRIERERQLIEAGVIGEDDATEFSDNQVIVSSSASFQFTYFYEMYQGYKKNILDGINTDDKRKKLIASKYAIIQIGSSAILKVARGYLNETNLLDAKARLPSSQFLTEYEAQFVSDSGGFIPRSLLEMRQIKQNEFPCVEHECKEGEIYILAIDPSSGEEESNDWFAIVVIKIDMDKKIAYLVNASASTGKGWPHYVKLVRQYIKKFNPKYIIADAFGGGTQMASLLCDKESTLENEKQLIRLEKDDITTYNHAENRIFRMNTPTNQFNEQSNLNLKSALEHGAFWFASPINQSIYEKYTPQGEKGTKILDELEESSELIEESKTQISLIVGSQGSNGLTTFGMPESLGKINKKQRMRKDLYSATLLGAWAVKEYYDIVNQKPIEKTYQPTVFIT